MINFDYPPLANDHLMRKAYSTLLNIEKVRGCSGVDTPIETFKKPMICSSSSSTVLNRMVITAKSCDVALVLQAYLTMSSGAQRRPWSEIGV